MVTSSNNRNVTIAAKVSPLTKDLMEAKLRAINIGLIEQNERPMTMSDLIDRTMKLLIRIDKDELERLIG